MCTLIHKHSVHITSPTRPLSIWSGDGHPPVLACCALSSASRGLDWFGSLSRHIFDGGGGWLCSGGRTFRCSGFDCRF